MFYNTFLETFISYSLACEIYKAIWVFFFSENSKIVHDKLTFFFCVWLFSGVCTYSVIIVESKIAMSD